jgi:putative transcriptional regulator
MPDVLADKRTATRFRILVAIAERQPAVSQGEIADAVGVTSQAVSEYVQSLTDDGYVNREGRSRYRVTKEGVDWLLGAAEELDRYLDRVTGDVLGTVSEDAAVAAGSIREGETVTLRMQDGLLHAIPGADGPATGVATTDASDGGAVGVTGFEGVIEFEPGTVSVLQIPPVRSESRPFDRDRLTARCRTASVVTAAGVEAVVALDSVEVDPDTTFAAGEVAGAAASRGLDAVVVATTDAVGRVTDAVRDAGVDHEVIGLGASTGL